MTYYSYVIVNEPLEVSDAALLPPDPAAATLVLPAPGGGLGAWAGSPSAVLADGEIYLAYRLRTADRRGQVVQVARSADGVSFEPLVSIGKQDMDAESLERPALVRTREGTWRLYLSCATWGTKHWRVELLEAGTPDGFDSATRRVLLPGDAASAVKDPVIAWQGGQWHLWASVHPLTERGEEDRMTTQYATSPDGIAWTWQGTALACRPGEWDARGARVSAVRFGRQGVTAYYDGRATAAQDCEERTGIAFGATPGALTALGDRPVAESPAQGLGLRYLTILDLGDGRERLYYELTNASGSHDLVTELRGG